MPATLPKTVVRLPEKTPVLAPVSVSVRDSLSDVVVFWTVTLTVCAVEELLLRSLSVTDTVMALPTLNGLGLVPIEPVVPVREQVAL